MHAHGPLGTVHENLEGPSPVGCNRHQGLSVSQLTLMPLSVSATSYNNSQIIDVSWTPQPNVCNDDYIGAFFTEILPARRKIQICLLHTNNYF